MLILLIIDRPAPIDFITLYQKHMRVWIDIIWVDISRLIVKVQLYFYILHCECDWLIYDIDEKDIYIYKCIYLCTVYWRSH